MARTQHRSVYEHLAILEHAERLGWTVGKFSSTYWRGLANAPLSVQDAQALALEAESARAYIDVHPPLYTIASLWGTAGNPDDREAVQLIDGRAAWPLGAFALASVLYFRDRAEAQRVADLLGPHREGARVSVVEHSASAPYIWQAGSPIR